MALSDAIVIREEHMNLRTATAALAASVLLAIPAAAQFVGPGQGTVTTVAEAHGARDDTPFDLTGTIVERLRDEYYTFQDETGTITAEIEDRRFRGIQITPETRVRITGEVERSIRGRELDVDRLEIVQ
jgi:uncharacterized protein (TIGR00156 family)